MTYQTNTLGKIFVVDTLNAIFHCHTMLMISNLCFQLSMINISHSQYNRAIIYFPRYLITCVKREQRVIGEMHVVFCVYLARFYTLLHAYVFISVLTP